VRRPAAARTVAEDMRASTGNNAVEVRSLDVSDLASVRRFCADWTGPLQILINNAGIMALQDLQRTPGGWEMQFATNFLGHFALTTGLHAALAAASGARIVCVSSSANMMAPVFFDDPHFNFIPYNPWLAYGQSKTANVLMAVEATRRWANAGIFANALNPGAIPTNLQRHVGGKLVTPPEKQKTTQQGAATSVLLATSRQLEGIGGRYFEDCNEANVVDARIILVAVSLLMLSIRKMPSDFGASQRQCWRRNDGNEFSKLLIPHLFEFVVARVAEALQQINRAVDGHFAQFDKALVRLQIGIQDFSGNVFGAMDHRL
jgi:NAD(P)-dependent dehydrogenase (short-subunit alcohol dehydrogenase family)